MRKLLSKMLVPFGYLTCLLLNLPFTQASLTITIPRSPIQANPGSDVLLPCHIEVSGHLNFQLLSVTWRVGSNVIAKFEDTLKVSRQGAQMFPEELKKGNASLLLPDVQVTDSNTYTCFVIYVPDRGMISVELRVEAPPRIKLGSTKVQLTKPSQVACRATDFYPGNISVTWFRNNKIVQGPELLPAEPSIKYLFRAESVLKLTPQITDTNANFSCHVHHQAAEGPLVQDFQLQLQALPILQLITKPPGEKFMAAICNMSQFYPSQIHIQWLQNGVPQQQVKSEVHRLHNGMFTISSVLFPQKSDVEVTYACRVEHEALEAPLEQSVLWRPEVTPTISSIPVIPWLMGLAIGFGVGLTSGVATMYCKYKVKNTSDTGTSDEKMSLQRTHEQKVFGSSVKESVNPEAEEQRL